MSYKVAPFGVVEIAIAANQRIALNSKSPAQVYQYVGAPNQPNSLSLIKVLVADEDYSSAAFSAACVLRIEAGASDLFYNFGTQAVIVERRSFQGMPGTVPTLNATGTLTAAMILFGLVTSTTGAAVAATVDTGAVLDAAVQMQIGDTLDWSVINLGAANAFTVTASSGHTLVGVMAVALSTSARFRTVKTAAATFITYRMS